MLLCALVCCAAVSAEPLEPIRSVAIGPNRSFQVNERPFFPIMIWLQDPGNFPRAEEAGINTVAGYWPQSGGTKDVAEYLELVRDAGLYGVMPYDGRLRGSSALLAYIHDDEPDLSHLESNAEVIGGEGLRINRKTPLWKIVDGVTHSWSVLDPLEGATVTVKLAEPVTVARFGIWLTVSPGLSVAKQVVLSGAARSWPRRS